MNTIDFSYIVAGVLVGGAVGATMALRIQMTSMPQMVALLNGFGGGASLTIALAEYLLYQLGSHPRLAICLYRLRWIAVPLVLVLRAQSLCWPLV